MIIRFIIFISVFALLSCSNDSVKESIVVDSTKPYEYKHFSIVPPGVNWKVTEKVLKNSFKLEFYTSKSDTHTMVGYVNTILLDDSFSSPVEMKKSFNDLWFKQYNDSRYMIIKNSLNHNSNDLSGYSLSHIIIYKDFQAPNKSGNEYLLSEGYEDVFIHPDNNKLLMYISYSERGTDKELVTVMQNAQAFISKFRLKVK